MCVTFFCLKPNIDKKPGIQFVIGFNRDQKTQRDTDPLGPFAEDPNIYAGRDKISGGTWLGINIKTGIMVILTNFDLEIQRNGKSRGKLVYNFLKTTNFQNLTVQQYNEYIQSRLSQVLKQRQKYSAFNLLIYSIQTATIFYICSEMQLNKLRILEKGRTYGMCNGPLDELWQKTDHGLNKFDKVIERMNEQQEVQEYFFRETFGLLKDNVSFDQNLEEQASIFINPYYSQTEKAERMTKCSFCCLIKTNQDREYEIQMKQITYTSPNLDESKVEFKKKIGQQLKKQ